MSYDIRNVKSIDDLIRYFIEELHWNIDLDDFDEIDDITYDFDAADIGLKEEAFANISSLRQLQPISDYQKWGIFCVEFDSDRFVVSALRKILSGLVPKRRNAAKHAVWSQKDLLFLCFWGRDNNRTIGIAHFEDKENGLPLIKMISCAPAIEEFTNIKYFEEQLRHLSWVRDESDIEAWYEQWSSAFTASYREVIQTSSALTLKLAAEAQKIRNRILEIYDVETDDGYVHKLYEDFKKSLIHEMTEQQFADMYAQTVVYGLFSARCMDKTPEDFSAREAVDCIPITNPFLKRLMEECLGEGVKRHLTFDELEVSNVIDILLHTNTEMILKDFNRQTGGGREDPVIHFYEEFLTAYDKAQKIQRGVFYTPQPVVNYIIKSVDCILKTEFNLPDGLASEEQKEILVDLGKKRRERMRVPSVQILDPATGTGTFLRQTILQIYNNVRNNHMEESEEQINNSWNYYVPKHLLPRLNAFELMMAPYAVAHMKLAMVLKDTGYDFSHSQRLNVFLTNTLEEAGKDSMQLSLFENDSLAFESVEANHAKKNEGINVIIGNPPYSGISSNNNEFIANLINDYKYINGEYFNERKHWLNDDYVKFIRFCENIIEKHGDGILAFINNHAFIDNPTFRCMRYHLLKTFDKIYILDLHGNVMRKEFSPNGERDENVFDIMQGVSINIFIKKKGSKKSDLAEVFHADMFGSRQRKYERLNKGDIEFKQLSPTKPYYFFIPKDISNSDIYEKGFSLNDLFLQKVTGVVTSRDDLVINKSYDGLLTNIEHFADLSIPDEIVRNEFFGGDTRGWKLSEARKSISNFNHKDYIQMIDYRPFDKRYIYYSNYMVDWGREKIFSNMLKDNIALVIPRQAVTDNWSHVGVSTCLVDNRYHYSNKGIPIVCPLFLYDIKLGKEVKSPNFDSDIINTIQKKIGLNLSESLESRHSSTFLPIDLFDYIYAILHSTKYRTKYIEFLKVDFPRIPYPISANSFWRLVDKGRILRNCHLLNIEFDISNYSFIGEGTNEVVKPEYKKGKVYINKSQFFDNVPQLQWEQFFGGYQPLQKWLKDRKKTPLSVEDVEHYKKIIAALKLTQELMAQIDEIVDL